MRTWPISRRVAELVRTTRQYTPTTEPHDLRQTLEATVWRYLKGKVIDKETAADLLRQIAVEGDRLPPRGASLFDIRSTRESQNAPTDTHRVLATWLMGLAWEQLKVE